MTRILLYTLLTLSSSFANSANEVLEMSKNMRSNESFELEILVDSKDSMNTANPNLISFRYAGFIARRLNAEGADRATRYLSTSNTVSIVCGFKSILIVNVKETRLTFSLLDKNKEAVNFEKCLSAELPRLTQLVNQRKKASYLYFKIDPEQNTAQFHESRNI